jgi:hypothetical protein
LNNFIAFIFFLAMISNQKAFAVSYRNELLLSPGITNINFSENDSTAENTSSELGESVEVTAQSGTVSSTSLAVNYRLTNSASKVYFLDGILPLMGSNGTGYFYLGGGVNFYFLSSSSQSETRYKGIEVLISPEYRFYWGVSAGLGYLLYETTFAEKTDVLFELGPHLGVQYNFSKDWGGQIEAKVTRGTGIETTTLNSKIFVGVSYYLNLN